MAQTSHYTGGLCTFAVKILHADYAQLIHIDSHMKFSNKQNIVPISFNFI